MKLTEEKNKYMPNERIVEYKFAIECVSEINPVSILDVGTGYSAWTALLANCRFEITELDNLKGFKQRKYIEQANVKYDIFRTLEIDITKYFEEKIKFSAITCISTLEHIPAYNEAVARMFNALKPGGHLIMTFPYTKDKFYENVYDLQKKNPNRKLSVICHSFSKTQIEKWLAVHDAELVREEFYRVFTGKYWRDGKKYYPKKSNETKAQLACFMFKKKS